MSGRLTEVVRSRAEDDHGHSNHPSVHLCTHLCVQVSAHHSRVFILSSLTGEYCAQGSVLGTGGYQMTRTQSLSWRPSQSRKAQDSVIG